MIAAWGLRVEGDSGVLGARDLPARFSWRLPAGSEPQTACQILCATERERLKDGAADLWDSGRVESAASLFVAYAGRPLASRARVWWTVRYWTAERGPSPWAEPRRFEVGLLRAEDWSDAGAARWITAPWHWGERPELGAADLGAWIWAPPAQTGPFELAKTFSLDEAAGLVDAYAVGCLSHGDTRALLYVNGVHGYAGGELQSNGTDYPAFEGDVSPWLQPGRNEISLHVDSAPEPGFAMRLLLRFSDGTERVVATDEDWRVRAGGNESACVAVTVPARPRRRLYARPFGAPVFRRAFTLPGKPVRARLYVCGLGYQEAWLNGRRQGDPVLDPAQTEYPRRAFHTTLDVTSSLKSGNNVLGLVLADGWYGQNLAWHPFPIAYGQPAVMARLEVVTDRGDEVIVTDGSWHAAAGSITDANVYRGEVCDARQAGTLARYAPDDPNWQPAVVAAPGVGAIEPQTVPPMRRGHEYRVARATEPRPGAHVYDLGANITGWVRLKVRAPRDTRVRLRFAEALRPDGTLDFRSTGPGATRIVQRDEFVCAGGGQEIYEPRFTYHGFRYVELSGLPAGAHVDSLTGVAVHTDLPPAGQFSSSVPMLNTMERLTRRTLLNNAQGILTDCPHRERCQWHADAEVILGYSLYAFEAARLIQKVVDDAATTAHSDGMPKDIGVGRRTWPSGDIGWGTIVIQAPWHLYHYGGDLAPARRHFGMMRRFVDTYLERNPSGVVPGASYGDHAPPPQDADHRPLPPCPKDAYATTLLCRATETLAALAHALGEESDAGRYESAARYVRSALIGRFYNPAAGGYAHPTLDAYALLHGYHPEGRQEALVHHFAESLRAREHMNVGGFFGYRRVAEAAILHLPEEEALKVLTQDRHPGLPWSITHHDAASVWERFHLPDDPQFTEVSRNHFAFGAVCELFWRLIAGIQPDAPGFHRVRLAPALTHAVPEVEASHLGPYGPIRSAYRRTGDEFTWSIDIPPGSTALARVPLTEGKLAGLPAGAQITETTPTYCTLELPAGSHTLHVR